ncbi:MAG: hypothetical protein A2Z16_16925 [Chloroflexi bacterium RBG_16_54_18]|nr:MAG: hypothetical protein A2Z16_16925 [Chloroflexi bacterium RBG_16_54_18]
MGAYKNINRNLLGVIAALILAAAMRFCLVYGGYISFNSDEAIVGLMARHILQGERPVFFYGQAYMGSLDALLVAIGFYLFGEQVWVIRLVQSLLFLGVMITTYSLGVKVFASQKTAALAVGLLAVPSVNVILYTTASLGGYGEALLIGNLVLLVGLRIADKIKGNNDIYLHADWLGLGFLIGLGFWAFGLTLVYSIPTGIFLVYSIRKASQKPHDSLEISSHNQDSDTEITGKTLVTWLLSFSGGLVIGLLPVWNFALENGLQRLILELQGEAIRGIEGLPWLLQSLQHLIYLVIFGGTVIFGLRPPWDFTWLGLPLIPFILVFWTFVIGHIIRYFAIREERQRKAGILLGVILAVVSGFVFSPFGADPSGRYFVPLAIPLTLFAADYIVKLENKFGLKVYGLAALLLVYNFWGLTQSALRYPPGITTQFYEFARIDHRYDQELIDFLLEEGEARGYSNYWVSYPIAFLSQEELIYIPRLPYHPDLRYTLRDDRYSPFTEQVENAERAAYITTKNPLLDRNIREGLLILNVSWQEHQIGDYQIFYNLSKMVRPEELRLLEGES